VSLAPGGSSLVVVNGTVTTMESVGRFASTSKTQAPTTAKVTSAPGLSRYVSVWLLVGIFRLISLTFWDCVEVMMRRIYDNLGYDLVRKSCLILMP